MATPDDDKKKEPEKTPDPPDNQPAAQPPPITTPQASQLAPGHTGATVSAGGTSQPGQQPGTVTTTASAGLFKGGPVSAAGQFGHTDSPTGPTNSVQGQETVVVGGDNTTQHSLLFTQGLTMNPKLAKSLGVGYEYDWGGDNPNRPKYQVGVAASGGEVRDGQVGKVTGDGHTATGSVAFFSNTVSGQDLNPSKFVGVEGKFTGTEIRGPAGGAVDLNASAALIVGLNKKLDGGDKILSVSASGVAGLDHVSGGHGATPYAAAMVNVGVSWGGTPKKHESPDKPELAEPPKPEPTHVAGTLREVDKDKDLIRLDMGRGVVNEYKLSEFRNKTDDPKAFDAAMQHGHFVDIAVRDDGKNSISDSGPVRNDAQAKAEMLAQATVKPNGDMQIGNLTVRKELADYYKPWLAAPAGKDDHELIDQLSTLADKKEPTTFGRDDGPEAPGAHAPMNAATPKLGVHMNADGTGPARGPGLQLKGCTVDSVEDKHGVTTVNYTLGGRHAALSVSDTAGSFAHSKDNPYNTQGIEGALRGDEKSAGASKEMALNGIKDAVRGLDASRPGASASEPLASPKHTTAQDLFKRATTDEHDNVHIGNLTIKKEVAGVYLKAMNETGARDPELIARIERLADDKHPTELNLANTKEAALKARDAMGFGDPANPLKEPLSALKPGEKFDLSIDRNGVGALVNRSENQELKIQPDGRVDSRPVQAHELARQPAGHAL